MRRSRAMATAVGIGVVAGLRSMTAPAVTVLAVQQRWVASPGRRFTWMKNDKAVAGAWLAAAGEWVVDKLPATPNRTEPAGLAARFVTGASSAALLCGRDRKSAVQAALLGGVAAIGAAFAGYQLRSRLRRKLNVSDLPIAIAEDAIAIGGGMLLAHGK